MQHLLYSTDLASGYCLGCRPLRQRQQLPWHYRRWSPPEGQQTQRRQQHPHSLRSLHYSAVRWHWLRPWGLVKAQHDGHEHPRVLSHSCLGLLRIGEQRWLGQQHMQDPQLLAAAASPAAVEPPAVPPLPPPMLPGADSVSGAATLLVVGVPATGRTQHAVQISHAICTASQPSKTLHGQKGRPAVSEHGTQLQGVRGAYSAGAAALSVRGRTTFTLAATRGHAHTASAVASALQLVACKGKSVNAALDRNMACSFKAFPVLYLPMRARYHHFYAVASIGLRALDSPQSLRLLRAVRQPCMCSGTGGYHYCC
jgi:hypothetical protein